MDNKELKDPTSAEEWFNLGVLKYKKVDRDGAIAAFERVLEIDPNDKRAADLLKMARDTRDAERRTQEASQAANKERTDRRRRLNSQLLISIGIVLIIFGVIYAVAYPMLYMDLIERSFECARASCSQMSELLQQIESWSQYFWLLYDGVLGVALILGIYCCVRGAREARMLPKASVITTSEAVCPQVILREAVCSNCKATIKDNTRETCPWCGRQLKAIVSP